MTVAAFPAAGKRDFCRVETRALSRFEDVPDRCRASSRCSPSRCSSRRRRPRARGTRHEIGRTRTTTTTSDARPNPPPAPRGTRPRPTTAMRVGAAAYYPPPVDGPALRLPESPTRLYLDGAYAISDDLTALPYIAGKGRNVRVALGGALALAAVRVRGRSSLVNLTTIDVTLGAEHAAAAGGRSTRPRLSLGDLTLGAVWTERLAGERGADRRPGRPRPARDAHHRASSSTSTTGRSPTSSSPTTSTSSRR